MVFSFLDPIPTYRTYINKDTGRNTTSNQCCGSALVSVRIRIRIQLFILMRIQVWMDQGVIQCGSGSWSDLLKFKVTKSWIFYMKNILKEGNGPKTYLRKYRNLFERQETTFICKFGQFPCAWIRIRTYFQYGFGTRTASSVQIQIHNTFPSKINNLDKEP